MRSNRFVLPRQLLLAVAALLLVAVVVSPFFGWVAFSFDSNSGAACIPSTMSCTTVELSGLDLVASAASAAQAPTIDARGAVIVNVDTMPSTAGKIPSAVMWTAVALALSIAGILVRRALFAVLALFPMFMLAPRAVAETVEFLTGPSNAPANVTVTAMFDVVTGTVYTASALTVAAAAGVLIANWFAVRADLREAGKPVPNPLERLAKIAFAGRVAASNLLDDQPRT